MRTEISSFASKTMLALSDVVVGVVRVQQRVNSWSVTTAEDFDALLEDLCKQRDGLDSIIHSVSVERLETL